MQINGPWHEIFYDFAGACVQKSWEHWNEGKIAESWKDTIPARLAYLCDVIVDLIVIPFYLIGLIFEAVKGIFTRNWQPLHMHRKKLMEKTNHFFLSSLGFVISPALAYRYRDSNLAPYIIAARIIVILAGATYLALRH